MRTAAMDDYFFNEIKSHPGEAGPQKRTGLRCRVGQRDYRR